MTDFHAQAMEQFSKMVSRHSTLKEAIREALAHDRNGDSLQLVATLESALLADDGADIQASKIKT